MKKLLVAAAACAVVCTIGAVAYYGYKMFQEELGGDYYCNDFDDFDGYAYKHPACADIED